MKYYKTYDSIICLLLQFAANLSTTLSRERCESSSSMDNTAKLPNHCSDMEECRYDFVHLRHENSVSHSAVVTVTVSKNCSRLVNSGNASFIGTISKRTSLMVAMTLSFIVLFSVSVISCKASTSFTYLYSFSHSLSD